MRSGAVVARRHSVGLQSNPDYLRSHRNILDSEERRRGGLGAAADCYIARHRHNRAGLKCIAQEHDQEEVSPLPNPYRDTE